MTIQQCKYVLKIAECGSFNEAAKQLFVAQSTLSVSVKSLEDELNLKIFMRSGNGVYLTEKGTEFIRYARQITEQSDFVVQHFLYEEECKRLYISTQHYDFVADIFAKLISETTYDRYQFALREMKTYNVICEAETGYCDIGIIAIKGNDSSVMQRYLEKRGLTFTVIRQARPHVYLRKNHALANCLVIAPEKLKPYPYVTYEQGKHNISFFSEEIINTSGDKRIDISDRASLMNVLLATDSYTIGTGIMPSL